MKRDMDLIREILLLAEKHCCGGTFLDFDQFALDTSVLPENYPSIEYEELDEHIALAKERGLIEAHRASGSCSIQRLTWEGHEFLDNSRTPEVWNAAKKTAGHLSFGVFDSVLNHLAVNHGLGLLKSGFDAAVGLATGDGS